MLTSLWGNCPPTMCLSDMLILSPQIVWQVLWHGFSGSQHRYQILSGHSMRAFLFVVSCSRLLCGQTPSWKIARWEPVQVGFIGSGVRTGGNYWSLYVCTVLWYYTPYRLHYYQLSLWLKLFWQRKKLPAHRNLGEQLTEWVHSSDSLPKNFRVVRPF